MEKLSHEEFSDELSLTKIKQTNQNIDRKWIIYCHTNKINGKKYIGTTCKSPSHRWRGNGIGYCNNNHFYNAICKYGWNNFEHTILFCNLTKDDAYLIESKLIKQFNTTDQDYGYNISSGGFGGKGIYSSGKIYQFTQDGEFVNIYNSISDAEQKTGLLFANICACCNGRRKMSGKYQWSYARNIDKIRKVTFDYKKSNFHEVKKVLQYTLDGHFIKEWGSAKEASRNLHINSSNISEACNGIFLSHRGFQWRYKQDNDPLIIDPVLSRVERMANHNKKVIYQIDVITGYIIRKYDSIQEAIDIYKINRSTITNVLKGRIDSYKGYAWVYEEQLEEYMRTHKKSA